MVRRHSRTQVCAGFKPTVSRLQRAVVWWSSRPPRLDTVRVSFEAIPPVWSRASDSLFRSSTNEERLCMRKQIFHDVFCLPKDWLTDWYTGIDADIKPIGIRVLSYGLQN